MKKTYRNNNLIIGLLGIILFLLVISVFYIITFLSEIIRINEQAFAPLIVFTGFFIFLIAAMLLALSLFRSFGGR